MKILVLIPPHVPSYFNAGHHLSVFQVGAYLRSLDAGFEVTCLDAAALNCGWRDLCGLLVKGLDLIAIQNDFDGIDGLGRLMHYIRSLSPAARTITFGRLSKQAPGLFKRYGLDAIHCSGDVESGVAAYARLLRGEAEEAPGVMLRSAGYAKPAPGELLPAERWALPDVDEVPYADYVRMYRNDLNKYCGIPGLVELVVPVSRGCPVGCFFCDVPAMQGPRERRLPVARTVAYVAGAWASGRFEYVSFYSPIFTLDRAWVVELCAEWTRRGLGIAWKCATTLHHLDRELIGLMGRSGCVRISVGLETLDEGAASLPRIKRRSGAILEELAAACAAAGIELNCFVMVGLPGGSHAGTSATIARVLAVGARVRPTIYTPYDRIREDASEDEVGWFNRQLFVPGHSPGDEAAYYALIYDNGADRPTSVGAIAAGRGRAAASARAAAEPSIGEGLIARVRDLPAEEYREYRGFLNLASNELGHPGCTALAGEFLATVDPDLIRAYPYHVETTRRCAELHGVDPACAMLTAGSDDAIKMVCSLLVPAGGRLILQTPNYDRYERYGRLFGATIVPVPFTPGDGGFLERFHAALSSHGPAVAVLTNPDGFAGRCHALSEIAAIAAACDRHGHLLVIDEAYAAFAGASHLPLLHEGHQVVVIRSFSKSFGAAGLRIGALFAAAQHIAALSRWRSVNAISGLAAAYLDFCIGRQPDIRRMVADICATRDWLSQALGERGWTVHPSAANFLLVDPGSASACAGLLERLSARRIRVRDLGGLAGFAHHARITVWNRQVMEEALPHLAGPVGIASAQGRP